MLGPVLFFIYIADINSKLSKFAHDTKLYQTVSRLEDIEQLQKDLDSLHGWSTVWLMSFNKCVVMHVEHNNCLNKYRLY